MTLRELRNELKKLRKEVLAVSSYKIKLVSLDSQQEYIILDIWIDRKQKILNIELIPKERK